MEGSVEEWNVMKAKITAETAGVAVLRARCEVGQFVGKVWCGARASKNLQT